MTEWNLSEKKKEKLEMRLRQGSFFRYKRMQNSNGERGRKNNSRSSGNSASAELG